MSNLNVASSRVENEKEGAELIYRDDRVVLIDTDEKKHDKDIFDLDAFFAMGGNLTGRQITLYTEPDDCNGDFSFDEIIEPITTLREFHNPTPEEASDWHNPHAYGWSTDLEVVDQDGKVIFENLKRVIDGDRVSHAYLVRYDQGVERLKKHYHDAIPVQDGVDRLLLVNLTGMPVGLSIQFDNDVNCFEYTINPSRNFGVPTWRCLDGGYVHSIEGLPPARKGVVLMVSSIIAALGHQLGRYDLVAVDF